MRIRLPVELIRTVPKEVSCAIEIMWINNLKKAIKFSLQLRHSI